MPIELRCGLIAAPNPLHVLDAHCTQLPPPLKLSLNHVGEGRLVSSSCRKWKLP